MSNAISLIRPVTAADRAAVAKSAAGFCTRHNIRGGEEIDIDYWLYTAPPEEAAYRKLLWRRCFARALGEQYHPRLIIAYGHVGIVCL